MNELSIIILLTLLAGLAIPLGASLSVIEGLLPRWLETEFRHTVMAFGGGALLAAVTLVLVPEAKDDVSLPVTVLCFAAGGLAFMWLDRQLAKNDTPASQLVAMLSDFVPEALALGASFAFSAGSGYLLAAIIALQNIPEGFNAYREIKAATAFSRKQIIGAFVLIALLGPLAGVAGYQLLSGHQSILAGIMLFAGGGILYLVFQDIAPQARLNNHWAPPLGAVAGFLLGLVGQVLIGS